MGVLADFPCAHDHVIRQVDLPARDVFARFDTAFAEGRRLPGEDDDLRLFGRWAQMRLSLGTDGGHDHDERVLRLTRSVAETGIPWTVQDVRFLWSAAHALMTWRHTNYPELYRIPLAAVRRLDYADRRRVLEGTPEWFRRYHGRSGKPCTSSWRRC